MDTLASAIVGFAILALIFGAAFAPSIVVINLLLGWTLLGWVIALAWSLSAQTRRNEV